MAVSDVFNQFVRASAVLREHLPQAPEIAEETLTEYSSSHDVPDLAWLQQHLPPLAEVLSLLPSSELTLNIDASGYKVVSTIGRDAAENLMQTVREANDSELATDSLSDEAKQTLAQFRNLFTNPVVDLNTMVQQATALTGHGVPLVLALKLHFIKQRLIQSLERSTDPVNARIVTYLFKNQLVKKLENTTVDRFETEFLVAGRRTVFLVFDLTGRLENKFITVCGQDQAGAVEADLRRLLENETLDKATQILEFRQSQSFGNFAPRWLVPEFFALTSPPGNPNDGVVLKRELQRFQVALAAIFMADFVEANANGIYSVEYRAFKPKRFELERDELLAQQQHWPQLYELYRYAYDGVSGDKLEIVQQFISQFADNIATLCASASDIRAATKKTYDRTLIAKVEEYFEARQSVQERIQTAVAALTNDTITISREVSADLYKVMGVIAIAVAGSFFNKSIGQVALLLGFITIGIYLLIVVFYHLPTLNRAAELRKSQHDAYINSFADVLTPEEVQAFLTNADWAAARTTFEKKIWWTKALYLGFCLFSFVAAVIVVVSISRSTPAIPPADLAGLAQLP